MANRQFSLKFGIVNPAEWNNLSTDAPIPLQQHPTYGRALEQFGAIATQVTIHSSGTLVARALLIQRKLFGLINFTTLFRGPVWYQNTLSPAEQLDIWKAIKAEFSPWRWNFLCAMPELSDTHDNQLTFKNAGYRRVMSGFSTAWLDIRPTAEELRSALKGKWRNQLVGAEKSDIEISISGRKEHQYTWLLEKEAEQRSDRRYQATPLGLVPAFVKAATPKSDSRVLSVAAISGRRKIAGALFLLHGNSATYHIGWAGDEGRKANAQNKVLWEGILALKEAGIHFLDLGGLNTADLAGIARFKLGLGAEPITLAGAFI